MSALDWSPHIPSQVARFWSKVDVSGECWAWLGAVDKDGYGKFQINVPGEARQIHVRAHRFAWATAHGRAPLLQVLHSCDNPTCVRPGHLSEGTQGENLIQCAVRKRRSSVRLSVELVRLVRARREAGESVTAIARELGIPRETLFAAVHRRTWSHVT